MKIGVDFGTTHTSAAYLDQASQKLRFIPLDLQNKDPDLLRSMLYITRDQAHLLGLEAVQTYLREDTGRLTRFEDKLVGTLENTVAQMSRGPLEPDGPITIVYDVVVAEDVSANGRLIQSIKTALRDPTYEGTNIFGQYYSLQELIALILRQVRQQAVRHLGCDVREVVLGRPVRFTPEAADDARAEQRLREAAELAGFHHITFEKEPIAAALFYTHELEQAETIFVFDFGGGTLDMTVMQVEPCRPPQILATHGVLVGGDDLDSALMDGKVGHYFGMSAKIDESGAPFPHQMAELMHRWQTIPQLSRPRYLSLIRRAIQFGSDPHAFKALESLVMNNYGYLLFDHIEKTKRALSEAERATLTLKAEAIDLALEITRREFQVAIADEIGRVQRGLAAVLQEAGIAAEAIDTVVTTGGSSLIPIFQTILGRKFPSARLVQPNTFGSVTAGLALRATA